ncbi:MAG TPA: cytidylate kinase-like family protein [Solirubrobacteraceae bacterium]|nr:cytidylate kinase-like family protein [Solirubrobacteraceae bacterium]
MTVVALSAAYGAAGSRIGPLLAERLDVPFVDRAIAIAVAERLDISVQAAIAEEERGGPSLLERMLAGFAGAYTGAPAALPAEAITPADFHRASREALLAQAQTGRGVILGRGACAALREDPSVLRVRLTGPVERRVEQAAAARGIDRETARRALRALDRAHADYVRRFYDMDIDDPANYHMTLDATAFSVEACVDIIEIAARELNAQSPR